MQTEIGELAIGNERLATLATGDMDAEDVDATLEPTQKMAVDYD